MSQYVLIKRGLYYRPKARGYTEHLSEAGMFDKAEALKRASSVSAQTDGVHMKHVDTLLSEIDKERCELSLKLTRLDAAERHILGLRVEAV